MKKIDEILNWAEEDWWPTENGGRFLCDGIYDVTGIPYLAILNNYKLELPEESKNIEEYEAYLKERYPKAPQEVIEEAIEEEKRSITAKMLADFCQEHPDYKIGQAYQMDGIMFVLARTPPQLPKNQQFGDCRSTALLLDLGHNKVLILAEDD